MNTQNESMAVTEARKYKKLEALGEDTREMILELAARTKPLELVDILKEHGVETSVSTLRRFLLKQREREALEEGDEMRETVEKLASRGTGESLRKGTIEALRQKMYQRALVSEDTEEARELYRDLLKEEAKLKELELEGRKAAALEEGVKLQRLRIEVQARAIENKGTQRAKVVVDSGPVAVAELPGPGEREFVDETAKNLTEGREGNEEKNEREAKFEELWERMGEILNRGGRLEEKVLEARQFWDEGRLVMRGNPGGEAEVR